MKLLKKIQTNQKTPLQNQPSNQQTQTNQTTWPGISLIAVLSLGNYLFLMGLPVIHQWSILGFVV